MDSFYSGFKSLGESILKPTKSFFGSKAQSKIQPKEEAQDKKKSISIKIHAETEPDVTEPWFENPEIRERPEQLKIPTHKSRQETLSISTAASQHSPTKSHHGHTKSLMIMTDEEGMDGNPQDGDIGSGEAPLLFSKGGYETHVDTKGLKSTDLKKSIGPSKRMGGFVILEDGQSPPLKKPLFSTPQARSVKPNLFSKNGPGISISKVEESNEDEVVDPLTGSKVPLAKKDISFSRMGSFNHKRVPSNLSIGLSEINGEYGGNESMRAATSREKRMISTIWEDYDQDNQDLIPAIPIPKTTKHVAANSFFDFSPEFSKQNSVIIMPDQGSELEIELEDDSNNNSYLHELKEKEIESPLNQVKDKLIQEYKAIQMQKLSSNGIYLVPTSDPFIWTCLVFIRGGYYEKGKFKFQIQIPTTYPSDNVKVYALTKIYHPLINLETGELDLKLCDQTTGNKFEKIAIFIKSIFNDSKYLEKETSYNQEAGSKFTQNPYYFKVKAKDSVRLTQKNLLNENVGSVSDILNKTEDLREIVTATAKNQIKFDDKVQSLIENIKLKVKAS